jgi:RAD51-like protein 1
VGPSGVGKSQFCYQLTLALALPRSLGGVERVVMYVDTEGKFSAKRLEELVAHR